MGSPHTPSPAQDMTLTVAQPNWAPADGPPISSQLAQRYLLLAEAGRGAMGRVYRAYDSKLRREVALKLLRVGGADSNDMPRVLREAQAMAQLSHPNVVPVYDVESEGGAVFIAMEFVPGETLREWMKTKRSWSEVLAVFISAGQGLVAAHAAGIIHRDFKPANAILGADGRVRVMDFGLARGTDASVSATDEGPVQAYSGPDPSLSEPLTQAGVIMGTPGYMAPEQSRGVPASAATDQFSFCVALFEALFGRRPFHGLGHKAQLAAKEKGKITYPRDHSSPAWLTRIVVRGLDPDMNKRWPSMAELLEALGQDPGKIRRRRLRSAVVTTALLSAGALGLYFVDRSPEPCAGAAEAWQNVWNDDTRTTLSDAFARTQVSYASNSATRVAEHLDRYTATWITSHTDACEATHIRKEQSSALLDARMQCLSDRKRDVVALVRTLLDADAVVVRKSIQAVSGLRSLARCSDSDYVLASVVPPDPVLARRVQQAQSRVSDMRALLLAGRYPEALDVANELAEVSAVLEYLPLQVTIDLQRGTLLERMGRYAAAEKSLAAAFFNARVTGQDEVRARASIALVVLVGERQAHHEQGRAWAEHARVEVEVGGRAENRGDLLNNLGLVALAAGEPQEALEHHKEALGLREQATDNRPLAVATSLNNIAGAQYSLGSMQSALENFERALAIRIEVLGEGHPDTGAAIVNIGNVLVALGKFQLAEQEHRRALGIFERAFGSEHPLVATTVHNLAIGFSARSEPALAKPHYERGLAIRRKLLRANHPLIAVSLSSLASAHLELDDPDRAIVVLKEALKIQTETLGPKHPQLAVTLNNLGNAYHALGDYERALTYHVRNAAVREHAQGATSPKLAMSLANLGRTLDALGRTKDAVQVLERAREIAEAHAPNFRSEILLRLANALWNTKADRQRATGIIVAARDLAFDERKPEQARKAFEDWLAEHEL